ncbi:hypothetical protein FV242_24355 [Methylobacterium sp. WL64]|uniref:hypothetical protein n=1 Tax=Methylobacterium sp. WL64 TaxID=2603894 RepID=UPI0011C92DD1|nr:hypothetical protein [Methylobacterium sp. WL64]TXM99756.1 hypothetical protein FV242_24355 [Methylobacterium sp. WL64]
MNDLDRIRDLFPLIAALLLVTSLVQAHAARPAAYHGPGFSFEAAATRVKWHMLEVARNEHGEAMLYPGN